MEIMAFDEVVEFQRRAEPVLGGREAEYNFAIGLLADLAAHGWQGRYDAAPLLLLVEDEGRPVGLAMRTPPHGLLLTDLPAGAMGTLAAWLRDSQVAPPSVMGPKSAAEAFADEWSRLAAKAAVLKHALRTHTLRRVVQPEIGDGRMRQATAEDFELLVSWAAGFSRDIGNPPRDEAPAVRRALELGSLFVWVDQEPVAMANWSGPTPHGIRVNWVYTPPEQRRRGYATALVARLSQHLLDGGREFCFLFTDLVNPTANNIYRKIGYEGVCDYAEYQFE